MILISIASLFLIYAALQGLFNFKLPTSVEKGIGYTLFITAAIIFFAWRGTTDSDYDKTETQKKLEALESDSKESSTPE